jgi:hypothetical protein
MPPKKQQTLSLPKTRKSTKQATAVKNKNLLDENTIQIGTGSQPEATKKNNLGSKSVYWYHENRY